MPIENITAQIGGQKAVKTNLERGNKSWQFQTFH